MDILYRLFALVLKEFLAVLKDPRSRTVVVVPPIVQTIVFGYGATYDLEDVSYAVWNEDRSVWSRELLAGLEGSRSFRLVARLSHQEQIAETIDARDALMVVRVGEQFSRNLLQGRGARVQAIIDGRNSNTAMIALNYLESMVASFNERWRAERGGTAPAARLVVRTWFNPNLESRWFIVSGIVGILTLLVTLLVTALSVAREREQGTFDQLLVTPYRPAELLAGKALPGFAIGLGEATLIISIAIFWFGVPLRGSVLTLYAGLVVFLVSAVGVGLMISSLSATMQQGLLGAFLFMVPSVILSGFATPVESMAEPIQWITRLNPLRYMMEILRGVFLEGRSLESIVPELWPMALMGLSTLVAAAWLFRHRLY